MKKDISFIRINQLYHAYIFVIGFTIKVSVWFTQIPYKNVPLFIISLVHNQRISGEVMYKNIRHQYKHQHVIIDTYCTQKVMNKSMVLK